jgi:hypothetical protein
VCGRFPRPALPELAIAAFVLILLDATPVAGQTTVDLDSFRDCRRPCSLRPVQVAQLGDPQGPGSVQGQFVRLSYDAATQEFLMYVVGGTTLQVFDRSGRFIHSFGVRGGGPGEFQSITRAVYVDGNILALDGRRSRWLRFNGRGSFLGETLSRYSAGDFVAASSDSVVLGSVSQTPDAVGHPLHLLRLSRDSVIRHFGSLSGEYSGRETREPYSLNIRLQLAPDRRSVWLARPNRLRVEEWSLDGTLLRTVHGEPEWLRPVVSAPAFGIDPPPDLLVDIIETEGDHLWTTSYAFDRRWKAAIADAAGAEPDPVRYRDLRIDFWDLERRIHYGPHVWDDPAGFALVVDGRFMYYTMQIDGHGVPRIVVYAFEVAGAVPPGVP